MSRFDDFPREELATIHFALRMAAKLPMDDGTPEKSTRLADEAWSTVCRRVEERRGETESA